MKLITTLFFILSLNTAMAGTVTFKNCKSHEKTKIRSSLNWLKNNMSRLDARMGRNRLMDWPGNSRTKFKKKLNKDLKFVCANDRNKCKVEPGDTGMLLGQVVPVFAQKKITLCTNNIQRAADNWGVSVMSKYVGVIAHEVGHLIRLNAHRTNCVQMHEKPRFSKSVGLAAEYGYRGEYYNSAVYTALCN